MSPSEKERIPVQALLMPKRLVYIGKFLNFFSPWAASRYAVQLFLMPLRYDIPLREKKMESQSRKEDIFVDKIKRTIRVYHYGNSEKKILLVHGWSGTGTQLSKIADRLLPLGYSTVSFDAPAHGMSPGKKTNIIEFIDCIHHLDKLYGTFTAAIGHSLGGMSLLNAVQNNLNIQKLVIIGTANTVTVITINFVKNLQLPQKVATLLKSYFDKKYQLDLDDFSGSVSAEGVTIPTLVIHDINDVDVHYSAAGEINEKLKNGKVLLTEGLGHRKILGDPSVIDQILEFIVSFANK